MKKLFVISLLFAGCYAPQNRNCPVRVVAKVGDKYGGTKEYLRTCLPVFDTVELGQLSTSVGSSYARDLYVIYPAK